jgi:hypothetical protein
MREVLRDMNIGSVRTIQSSKPNVKYFVRKNGANNFIIVEANTNNLRSKTARVLTPQEWFRYGAQLNSRETLNLLNYINTVVVPNTPPRRRY